jgi:hypothetical protein
MTAPLDLAAIRAHADALSKGSRLQRGEHTMDATQGHGEGVPTELPPVPQGEGGHSVNRPITSEELKIVEAAVALEASRNRLKACRTEDDIAPTDDEAMEWARAIEAIGPAFDTFERTVAAYVKTTEEKP